MQQRINLVRKMAIAAGGCLCALSVDAGVVIDAKWTSYSNSSTIAGNRWEVGNNTVLANTGGPLYLGTMGLSLTSVNGVHLKKPRDMLAFCGEIGQSMPNRNATTSYQVLPLDQLDKGSAGHGASAGIDSGGIGSVKARLINILYDLHYVDPASGPKDKPTSWNATDTAAFQLAIWEFSHESLATHKWTLFDAPPASGSPGADFTRLGTFTSASVREAETWIGEVVAKDATSYVPKMALVAIENASFQDLIVPRAAIPEPRATWIGALLAAWMFWRRRSV